MFFKLPKSSTTLSTITYTVFYILLIDMFVIKSFMLNSARATTTNIVIGAATRTTIASTSFDTMSTINNNENNIQQQQSFCSLSEKKCKPCEGGDVHRLTLDKSKELLSKINKNWTLIETDPPKINRKWRMPFPKSVEFVNQVAEIAEQEGHHPDISIKSYWNLEIELYTHALNGLSENDFIVASKIDDVPLSNYETPKRKQK